MSRQLRFVCLVAVAALACGCLSFHPGELPGAPETANYAEVGDIRMRYVDVGEGDVVVMLHGFAASSDTWAPVLPKLVPEHRVIAPDLKGFGWTTRPRGDYSPGVQAALVFELLDSLGIEDFAIVAHSWGSSIALRMALARPNRVDRLVLYDAWVYESQLPTTFVWSRAPVLGEVLFGLFYRERPADKMELAFHDDDHVDQALVDHVREQMDRPGTTAAALAAARGQRYAEVEKRYGEIAQPTLLLWGAQDIVTPVDVGHRLVKQLPDARMEVFEACGHFPMIEAYHPSTSALVEFLESPEIAGKIP